VAERYDGGKDRKEIVMKKKYGVFFGITVLLIVVMFTMAGCDNGTEADTCRCVDKIHGNAPCDCGGVDCVCEQKEWSMKYNITLENQTGAKLGDLYEIVRDALDLIHDDEFFSGEDLSAVSRIIIVLNDDAASFSASTITVGKDRLTDVDNTAIEFCIMPDITG
jgi:hypothetical protein